MPVVLIVQGGERKIIGTRKCIVYELLVGKREKD